MSSQVKYYLDDSLPIKTDADLRPLWYFFLDNALVVALHPTHAEHFISTVTEIHGYGPIELTKEEFELLYTTFMLVGESDE